MQRVSHRVLFTIALLFTVVMIAGVEQNLSQAQSDQRCFSETGFCIQGRFLEYWEANGGLPIFGLPISKQYLAQVEKTQYQVQWFERTRFELHPTENPPYDVLLGRIGDDRLLQLGKHWQAFPTSQPTPGCSYFPQTRHNVCGRFQEVWQANGLEFDGDPSKSEDESLALIGLPLSDLTRMKIEGKVYTVQWFERARFEQHPEKSWPHDVLLGRLGYEVWNNETTGPTPTAQVISTPTLTP
jgi:hypothetical protein